VPILPANLAICGREGGGRGRGSNEGGMEGGGWKEKRGGRFVCMQYTCLILDMSFAILTSALLAGPWCGAYRGASRGEGDAPEQPSLRDRDAEREGGYSNTRVLAYRVLGCASREM